VEGSPSFSRRTASTSFAVGCSPKLLAPLLPAELLLVHRLAFVHQQFVL
jgi:hypothetical protein